MYYVSTALCLLESLLLPIQKKGWASDMAWGESVLTSCTDREARAVCGVNACLPQTFGLDEGRTEPQE